MHSINSAAAAAKQILRFYDTIPAADQQAFAAGFVEMLSIYPQPVLERAASPSRGLVAYVAYPNLAKFKEKLDEWHGEHLDDQRRRGVSRPRPLFPEAPRLPPPPRIDPPAGHFANVHIPATNPRYDSLSEWTQTAEPKYWKFGKSSSGVDGIWIPRSVWDEGSSEMKKIAAFASMTVDQIRDHYAKYDLSGRPKPSMDAAE